MKRVCVGCGKNFIAKIAEVNRGRGKYCDRDCWSRTHRHTVVGKRKIGNANRGANHGLWKGDLVAYNSLHAWVNRNLPPPKICVDCGSSRNIDAANVSGKYSRDLSDWKWQCRRNHMIEDGRMEKLKATQFAKSAFPL